MDFELEKKRGELYDVLGCNEKSSKEQIMTEYRLRAREMHPDKSGAKHDKAAFLKIQEAIAVLGDDQRRSIYDEFLRSPLPFTTFVAYERNISTVKQSTHWATVPSPPMLNCDEQKNTSSVVVENWNKNRHQSDAARMFRSYQM